MRVIGGGPAGAAAAIAALREGAAVDLYEKSSFPRHKVCGEFLSPEAALVFEKLAIADRFAGLKPHRVSRAEVTIGSYRKNWTLEEPAFGISRFQLDRFLQDEAKAAGAKLIRENATPGDGPVVIAHGRVHVGAQGNRLFGFKAHFSGPVNDAVELLFERDMYVGINSVESGATNVCGLAAETTLRHFQFRPDELLASRPALARRLAPMSRMMEWLITGPVVYGGGLTRASAYSAKNAGIYLVGDALGFVDPFTGSGMLGALVTGYLGGVSCARLESIAAHERRCRQLLQSQYRAAGLFRRLIDWGVADKLARLLPGDQMFRFTRPEVRFAI